MSPVKATNPSAPILVIGKWDKTFAESSKVDHRKVASRNRYRMTLAGDLYLPKDRGERKLAAIAASGPSGAVKEQSSGLYARTLAEQGFVTLPFDPSYTGGDGGYPRDMASPGINAEDFSAAVDFLGLQKGVDRNRTGLFGICGWGGMALNGTAMDTRVRAVATSIMCDMSHAMGYGVGDGRGRYTTADHRAILQYLDAQCWEDAVNSTSAPGGHDIYVDGKGNVSAASRILPETLSINPNPILKELFDYYRMPRGFHTHPVNPTGARNVTMPLSFMSMPLLSYASEMTIPTLIVTGERAHSRYFTKDAFKAAGSKEKVLVIVPGANHVDLYDNVMDKVSSATFTQPFEVNLQQFSCIGGIPEAACRRLCFVRDK